MSSIEDFEIEIELRTIHSHNAVFYKHINSRLSDKQGIVVLLDHTTEPIDDRPLY